MTKTNTTIGIYTETRDKLNELKKLKYNTQAVPTTTAMDDILTEMINKYEENDNDQ